MTTNKKRHIKIELHKKLSLKATKGKYPRGVQIIIAIVIRGLTYTLNTLQCTEVHIDGCVRKWCITFDEVKSHFQPIGVLVTVIEDMSTEGDIR